MGTFKNVFNVLIVQISGLGRTLHLAKDMNDQMAGADPALNLTGAQTENVQGKAGTGHRRCSALAAGGLEKPKGFRCSEMHSQPFLAIKIINSNDLLFKKFHFISSIILSISTQY